MSGLPIASSQCCLNSSPLNMKGLKLTNRDTNLVKSSFSTESELWDELLINTPGYKLPLLDPWHSSIRSYLSDAMDPDKDLQCSSGLHEYTWASGDQVFLRQNQLRPGKDRCCYHEIVRVEQSYDNYDSQADSVYRIESDCHPLNSSNTTIHVQAVFVKCFNEGGEETYRNIHYLFSLESHTNKVKQWKTKGCFPPSGDETKRAVKKRGEIRHGMRSNSIPEVDKIRERSDHVNDLPYSVVFFGVDSVSRQNMQRYMPQTFQYLKNVSAIDMQGYNKVGENTFPNLLAILVGKPMSYVIKECLHDDVWKIIDECPFIWKNFSNEGYLTAYGEDSVGISTFNYHRTGFLKEPTDFYSRPASLASENLIGHHGKLDILYKLTYGSICQGPLSSFDVLKKYSLEFAKTLGCIPHFDFYWTTRATHDHSHLASLIDKSALDYLQLVNKLPEFSRTFVFFLSDHGMRFGGIRRTKIGKLEENLPFVFIMVPSDFRERFPLAHRNLEKNQMRLTVPYDLHATLWDILQRRYENETYLKNEGIPSESFHGISLFQQIPDTRTCDSAGVPVSYCSSVSSGRFRVSSDEAEYVANLVVKLLNKELEKFPDCVQFTGHLVKSAEKRFPESRQGTVIQIQFQTYPGKAEMEATVGLKNRTIDFISEVSRIDRYAGQSDCIDNNMYEKYCYCKALLDR